MAEALGIASGIAGLVRLTIEVFGISYKYINGVRDASPAKGRFLKELDDLRAVLLRVDQYAQKNSHIEVFGDAGPCLLSIVKSKEYLDLLEKVRDKLQQQQNSSPFRTRMTALTWPFSEKETLALSESLHRHLEIYNTAFAVDSLTLGEATLSEVAKLTISQADSQVEAVLDWLSPLNMSQKQQDILSGRHGITSSWLLIDPVFQGWIDSESSQRTLWCPGNPGTGKTVITSVVIDHLLNNYVDEGTRIAYIYCDYKDQTAQTASNLVACLARQVLGRPKALPQQLEALHEELKQQDRRPSFDELKRLFIALCKEYARTYIIVDALDECEAVRERRLLLPLLELLPSASMRLFVTSRPNSEDISSSFSKASQITIAAPESDINRYIMERIDERKDFAKRLMPELKEKIVSTISNGASGMFLLAALQVDRIFATRTIKGIKSALTSMPDGLDELYRQALDRIRKQAGDDGALGMRILSWITHAKRPLSVDELRHGLAVEYEGDDEGNSADFDEDNLLSPESLVDVCAGLLVIESSSQIIRLVHFTTQEYFDKTRQHLFKGAEFDISRACLTYLSLPLVLRAEYKYDRFVKNPFLDYACQHWFSHVKNCLLAEDPDPVLLRSVACFKSSENLAVSISILLDIRSYTRSFSLPLDRMRRTYTLEVASSLGFVELVTILLDHRTGFCPGLDSSLVFASYSGHLKTVKLLLQYGARVDAVVHAIVERSILYRVGKIRTALMAACTQGHRSVAEILIENGADIHGKAFPERPPIHAAVVFGRLEIIDLLLKRGVNIDDRNSSGETACHLAARRHRMESARILLDAGCDVELTNDRGFTALHCAAKTAYLDVIELLLSRGADLYARDKKGRTARDLLSDSRAIAFQSILVIRDSERADPREREDYKRMLQLLEPKSSGPTTNDPKKNEPSSPVGVVSIT